MSFIFRRDRTRIVVNHLTRMQHGYICVAGIDPRTGEHIRPVLERDRLRYTELARHGGPFDIACIVDLGRTSYVGHAPEVEDYRFVLRNARVYGQVPAQEFWDLLKRVSKTRLRDIFGDDLYRQGPTFAVDEGKGQASLGCLLLARPPVLHVTPSGDVRLGFNAGPDGPSIKVTDLRFYEGEPARPRPGIVERFTERMAQGEGVILGVGLSRARVLSLSGDAVARHWLQVNNIYLEGGPVWQECSL
jgi:hypothetical protein